MLQAKTQLKGSVTRQEREARRAFVPTIPPGGNGRAAGGGDEAAISALRGMLYQEKREAKKAGDLDTDEVATNERHTSGDPPGYRSIGFGDSEHRRKSRAPAE